MNPSKLWQQLNQADKDVLLYLSYATPPVSIDTLISLSGASAGTILNLLEELKKGGMVYEIKGPCKGLYSLNNKTLAPAIEEFVSETDKKRIIKGIIDFYVKSLDGGKDKILTLAELYLKLGDTEKGLEHMKGGADILLRSGDKEQAIVYYDQILEHFANNEPTEENAKIFLESVLVKVSASKVLRPAHEHMSLLGKAEKIARRHKRWELLTRIKLELASELLVAGQTEQAASNIDDFRKLAGKVNDPAMLKMVALATSALRYWQGRILEATRSYEEVIGSLEEFGNDELTLGFGCLVGWCYVICGRIARGIGILNAIRAKALLLGFSRTVYIANIMKAHAFLEIRKISDAEIILNDSVVPKTHGNIYAHLVSWSAITCRAYIHYAKENYEEAFACHKKAVEDLPALGWIPKMSTWGLEYLGAIESRGFFSEKMNYQTETERLANGNDAYMKGYALRHRALLNMEKYNHSAEILSDLKDSEKYLKEAGAEIELARTRLAIGNYYLKKGNMKTAQSYLEKAWKFFSTVDKDLFPSDLIAIMPKEEKIEFMMNRMGEITRSLGVIRDTSPFLERALTLAMDFTMAMRGGFVVLESGEPKAIVSRGMDSSFFTTTDYKILKKVIIDAIREGSEVIIPGSKGSGGTFPESPPLKDINSLICMPAKLGEHIYGFLCLDSRLGGTPFPAESIPFIRILCDQIAVGLSNINMYNEMKELKDRFEEEASFYKQEMGIAAPLEMIVGQSKAIAAMTSEIRQVAPTDSSVLILGETGAGKELVAKAIHGLSARKDGPFIPVNLAALPHELVASELFGHEKGAFTGANERRKGRFELADTGTIFLDEIGDLPPQVQVKLLRVLQEGTFERLGSAKPVRSNFRVIAATNKDLHLEVEKGIFRQDLYFRLNVFPIHIPPLRDRKEDVPLLARFFLDRYGRKLGKKIKRIPPEELKKLLDYHWPGNVRELEHFIERAVVLSDGHGISFSGFAHEQKNTIVTEDTLKTGNLADLERRHIEKVLNNTNWKVSGPYGAAIILGLKPTTLFARMEKLGIKKPKHQILSRE